MQLQRVLKEYERHVRCRDSGRESVSLVEGCRIVPGARSAVVPAIEGARRSRLAQHTWVNTRETTAPGHAPAPALWHSNGPALRDVVNTSCQPRGTFKAMFPCCYRSFILCIFIERGYNVHWNIMGAALFVAHYDGASGCFLSDLTICMVVGMIFISCLLSNE